MSSNFEILGQFKREKDNAPHLPLSIGDDVRVLMGELTESGSLHIKAARMGTNSGSGNTLTVLTEDDEVYMVSYSRVYIVPADK